MKKSGVLGVGLGVGVGVGEGVALAFGVAVGEVPGVAVGSAAFKLAAAGLWVLLQAGRSALTLNIPIRRKSSKSTNC